MSYICLNPSCASYQHTQLGTVDHRCLYCGRVVAQSAMATSRKRSLSPPPGHSPKYIRREVLCLACRSAPTRIVQRGVSHMRLRRLPAIGRVL